MQPSRSSSSIRGFASIKDSSWDATEEKDFRSIYVENVDYGCTSEEIRQHFQACGTVNRVTILTDQFEQPKGSAYVEFLEHQAVRSALLLNESILHSRKLKVCAKRTNIPVMRQYVPRRGAGVRYMGGRPSPFYLPPGCGRFPGYVRAMSSNPK